jgi:hypothetical protein
MRRVLVLALALLLPACDRELLDQDAFAASDLSGAVRIPLSTTAEDGTTYLLRDATIEISGAAMMTLTSPSATDLSSLARPGARFDRARGASGGDALTTQLPAGSYTLFLRPGFTLIEVDPSGSERRIEAALAGDNPLHFSLREIQDRTLKLTFAEGDRRVVFGAPQSVRVTRAF